MSFFLRIYRSKNHIPADPISLSLAYKAQQRAKSSVPEEKLQYGFRKPPKNLPHIKHFPNIDEGKLFAVDRTVVELKPSARVQEEEEIEEEEEEEQQTNDIAPGHLGYSDIGYYPSKCNCPKFTTVHYNEHVEKPCKDPLPLPEIGCCGFRPGKIVQETEEEQIYDSEDGNFFDCCK